MGNRIVNRAPWDNSRCWCPVCEVEEQRVGYMNPWVSPSGKLVCFYGVCAPCGDGVVELTREERTRVSDRIERALLGRYPFLADNLPKGYQPA